MALTTVAQYLAPGETNCTAQIYLHHYFANLAFRLKASLSGKEMLRPSDLVELTDFKRVGGRKRLKIKRSRIERMPFGKKALVAADPSQVRYHLSFAHAWSCTGRGVVRQGEKERLRDDASASFSLRCTATAKAHLQESAKPVCLCVCTWRVIITNQGGACTLRAADLRRTNEASRV